jgi:hypothetical protein
MRTLKKLAIMFLAALLASTAAHAQTLSNAYTYSGLTWALSTSTTGLTACNELVLDATGDVYNSDNFAVYGQLYCPSLGGSYAASGNAYFDSFNNFHMTVSLGVTYQMVCDNLSGATLSGSCPIYNNLGAQTGTAFITFF